MKSDVEKRVTGLIQDLKRIDLQLMRDRIVESEKLFQQYLQSQNPAQNMSMLNDIFNKSSAIYGTASNIVNNSKAVYILVDLLLSNMLAPSTQPSGTQPSTPQSLPDAVQTKGCNTKCGFNISDKCTCYSDINKCSRRT